MPSGSKSRTAAILTGDLIGSTDAPANALERAMDALAATARGISDWTPWSDAGTRFTRFRGDGWQAHVADPGLAVLTGDIIRSTRRSPEALDAAMATLAAAAAAMSAWDGGRPARFTRFRGDGWQCLAPAAGLALRAVLFLRANLRALDRDADTRVSVGIGPGRWPPR